MQRWSMTEGICETEGADGVPTYGIAVVLADGARWQWADVDTDPRVVEQLVHRMQQTQPEPCHFAEMTLDFIQEMAAKV